MVIEFGNSKMTAFKAPSRVKFVDELPKSLGGKSAEKRITENDLDIYSL